MPGAEEGSGQGAGPKAGKQGGGGLPTAQAQGWCLASQDQEGGPTPRTPVLCVDASAWRPRHELSGHLAFHRPALRSLQKGLSAL